MSDFENKDLTACTGEDCSGCDGCGTDGEVYIYRFQEINGEPSLDNIMDDDEYERVADAFDELLDDSEYDELVDADDEN